MRRFRRSPAVSPSIEHITRRRSLSRDCDGCFWIYTLLSDPVSPPASDHARSIDLLPGDCLLAYSGGVVPGICYGASISSHASCRLKSIGLQNALSVAPILEITMCASIVVDGLASS